MKTKSKLSLNRTTLRKITDGKLEQAAGAGDSVIQACPTKNCTTAPTGSVYQACCTGAGCV